MKAVALDYRPALFSRGGIARSVRELVRCLPRAGDWSLHLFGHGLGSPLEASPEPAGILHRSRLPGRILPLLASLGWDAPRLAGRAGLFHWTDYVYPPVRRARTKVVMTVHDLAFFEDPEFHGRGTGRLRRRFVEALRRADQVVCPSRATAKSLERRFPLSRPPSVIPFGADHVHGRTPRPERGRERARSLLGTEAPYLCTLGTLEPRKNHESLLEALGILASGGRSVPLLVLGAAGWGTAGVQKILKEGKLPFPCRWLCDAPDAEVFDLLSGARALAYPSSLEGFGFPPLEALELGVPVLAGDCEALRETLGPCGLYVEPREVEDIARGLSRLMEEEDLRSSLLHPWKERRRGFLWEDCGRRHAELYASLLGKEDP